MGGCEDIANRPVLGHDLEPSVAVRAVGRKADVVQIRILVILDPALFILGDRPPVLRDARRGVLSDTAVVLNVVGVPHQRSGGRPHRPA